MLFLLAAAHVRGGVGPVPDGDGDRAAAHAGTRHEHSCAAPRRVRFAGDRGARRDLGGHDGVRGESLRHCRWLALVHVHVAWGFGGWALMLVIGVSYMVVPMFQMTPGYPECSRACFPPDCSCALPVDAAARCRRWRPSGLAAGVALAGVLLAGSYAVTTLWLQSRRRRRRTDATFVFWRGAMLSLLAFSCRGLHSTLGRSWAATRARRSGSAFWRCRECFFR